MADFRTKLMTLAGVAAMFAGMAHAQTPVSGCTTGANAIFVAAEGTNEQVADTTITCTTGTAATMNIQVYLSPAVSITSAILGTGNNAKSETLAGTGVVGGPLGANAVSGTVSGSSVTFNNVAVPAAPFTLTITNIKVNASQIATSTGAPTAVSETIFVGGTNVTPSVLAAVNVAFAQNGLAAISTNGFGNNNSINSVSICSGITAFGGASFNVLFSEGFATAFKTKGSATAAQANQASDPGAGTAANTNLGDEFTRNTYTGYTFSNGTATNQATSGTRISIVFNNIPANVTVYAPLTVTLAGPPASTLTLVQSATGAYSPAPPATNNGAPGPGSGNNSGPNPAIASQLTVANGSATAIYEVTANNPGAVESYVVPIYLSAGAAAVTAPSTAITATVSFAPIGSSSNVPNYVSGSSTATKNGAAFSACSTTLLFPFVTNQLGFDTGIAIANTSTDTLKSGGKTQATPQSGTCSLSFFGNTAPSAAVTTPTVTTGTTYAAAASTLAPGFQGYMIASCNFLYGHGFAYVVYNLTQNNGAAMGYLATAINADRTSVVTATAGVDSSKPETSGN